MNKKIIMSITLLILIVAIIGFVSYDKISIDNYSSFNPAFFFLPYGVILFAFMASPAIPELQEVLKKEKKKMKKAIIIGSLTPIVLYLIFVFVVGGVVGLENFELLQPNQRIATIALSVYSLPFLGIMANLLAVLAMFTSFLTLGIALVEVYQYDYKFSRLNSLLLTFSVPLVISLFNLTTFLSVLGITGAVAGGLDGILVTLMFWKAKKLGDRKPEYSLGNHKVLGIILILMMALGMSYQFIEHLF